MLVQLQHVDVVGLDDLRQVRLDLVHDHRAEVAPGGLHGDVHIARADGHFALMEQVTLGQTAGGAHQLDEQTAGIRHPQVEAAAGAQLHMQPAGRVEQANLAVGAPFDAHLRGEVDEIDLCMEGLALHGQRIEAVHLREDAGFQGIAAGAEGVKGLAVAQENGLLALMDDELTAGYKVGDGVLPHEGLVVALIADDRRNARVTDPGLLDFRLNVRHGVAHGAGDVPGGLVGLQLTAAGAAGKVHQVAEIRAGDKLSVADGTFGAAALGLIVDHAVAAGGAALRGHAVGFDIDNVAAAAADMPAGKKTGGGFNIVPAYGAGNHELAHGHCLLLQIGGRALGRGRTVQFIEAIIALISMIFNIRQQAGHGPFRGAGPAFWGEQEKAACRQIGCTRPCAVRRAVRDGFSRRGRGAPGRAEMPAPSACGCPR